MARTKKEGATRESKHGRFKWDEDTRRAADAIRESVTRYAAERKDYAES